MTMTMTIFRKKPYMGWSFVVCKSGFLGVNHSSRNGGLELETLFQEEFKKRKMCGTCVERMFQTCLS